MLYYIIGRVLKRLPPDLDISIDTIEDKYENGLYVSGWLATGPTGVILTTMNNSFSVANTVCEDFISGTININSEKPGLDTSKLHHAVSWDGWTRIDKAEIDAANEKKPREKIINISKMLEIAIK